jgi:general secretion pathway protein L
VFRWASSEILTMTLLVQNMAMNMTRFWGWWVYELGLLLPNWLRDFFYAPPAQLFARLNNFQITYSCFENGSEKILGSFYLHKEGKQLHDDFFKEQAQWVNATKILLLNSKQVLKKRLDLPLAIQNNLEQVISYELDRYTPFKPDQCYFTTQIVGKNKANNRLILELIFLSKQKFKLYCKELLDFGLVVDAVIHEDDHQRHTVNGYGQQYNLMPAEYRRNKAQNFKLVNHFLAGCFLLLTVIAIGLPFWFQHRTLVDLQQQVASVKHKAAEVDDIKAETIAMLQVEKKIVAQKRQAPVILNVVEQLSKLLPKDTWLRSFEYTSDKFLLQGLSASSSALIGLLEASPYFKQTTMVSPVTRDSQEKLDQFQLETYIESTHDAR